MKKSELKNILKPLVKECIKESLLEEGLLSSIISEVVQGVVGSTSLVETQKVEAKQQQAQQQNQQSQQELEGRYESNRQERIKRLNESAAGSMRSINVFEGTAPAPAENKSTGQGDALAGVASDDAGIDITGIMSVAGSKWKSMI
jgi:hypothetical protein